MMDASENIWTMLIGMFVMGILALAGIAGVLYLIVYAILWALGVKIPARQDPEEILKERYARGEIDDKEYQHRLSELRR